VKRSRFLLAASAPLIVGSAAIRAIAQTADDIDPAISAKTPSLRVLLGPGQAAANPGGGFSFEGRMYRGTFAPTYDGIVNVVGIEEYLYSVVPREMSPGWPAAALQAQAICARTYVLERSSPRRSYDVVPSQMDQVYSGLATESESGRAAVDATAGMVLRYGSAFAQTLYSSCCGGHTEASSDAWGGAPVPYLMGITCPYCTNAPLYRWSFNSSLEAIGDAFAAQLAPFGPLQNIRLGPADSSGRPKTVELVGNQGSAFVKTSGFRSALGAANVRSTFISSIAPASDGPGIVFIQGAGSGHGVGLCQWGARGAAVAGLTASQILGFYFPGTQLSND
jgi:stage II sporulation protein D